VWFECRGGGQCGDNGATKTQPPEFSVEMAGDINAHNILRNRITVTMRLAGCSRIPWTERGGGDGAGQMKGAIAKVETRDEQRRQGECHEGGGLHESGSEAASGLKGFCSRGDAAVGEEGKALALTEP
jgi:hypothetical protein